MATNNCFDLFKVSKIANNRNKKALLITNLQNVNNVQVI